MYTSSPEMTTKELEEATSTIFEKIRRKMDMIIDMYEKRWEERMRTMEAMEQSREVEKMVEDQSKAVIEDLDQTGETVQTHSGKMREDTGRNSKRVWEGVEEKMEEVERQEERQLTEMKSEVQNRSTMMYHRQMMTAIRGKRLEKSPNEKQEDLKRIVVKALDEKQKDLKRVVVKALEKYLGEEAKNFSWQTDRIHRVWLIWNQGTLQAIKRDLLLGREAVLWKSTWQRKKPRIRLKRRET